MFRFWDLKMTLVLVWFRVKNWKIKISISTQTQDFAFGNLYTGSTIAMIIFFSVQIQIQTTRPISY